jgi:acetyl esterase/lipase
MFKISYLTASLFSVTLLCAFGGPTPSHKDVQYSKKYSRSKLDVWLPENTSTPCPIIVYFHGGGFKAGDKSKFYNNRFLTKYLEKGISFASVNYPLLKDAGYLEIMTHTSESIKFLKSQAALRCFMWTEGGKCHSV